MDDIARYGAYLANEKNASQNTISSYLRDVTQFAEYLQNTQSCGLRLATGDMIPAICTGCRDTENPPLL